MFVVLRKTNQRGEKALIKFFILQKKFQKRKKKIFFILEKRSYFLSL